MLLIGPHDDSDPGRNVYDLLYELAGGGPGAGPTPTHSCRPPGRRPAPPPPPRRTKPRCCDGTGAAPVVGSDVVDDLVARTRSLVRRRRRS
jgi:hypothetical protein